MKANSFRIRISIAVAAAGLALAGCSSTTGPQESSFTASTASVAPTASVPALSAAADSTAGYPVTVSSCGRDYTYEKSPSRVIVGNENSLQNLAALGVSDRVYGYVLGPDDAGKAPANLPANLVEVSATTIPAREPVIAAKPDLFLSFNEAQLTTQGSLSYDDLAGVGSNAYVMGAYCAKDPANRSIDTVYSDITNLGKIFGIPEKAAQINAALKERVAAAKKSLNGSTATVASLKVVGGKVYAIGGYPISAIAGALGLKNQFSDLPTPFAEINTEQALSMRPDVVFVNYVGDERAAIADLKKVLPDLPAVKDDHVYGIDESHPQGGGIGIIQALESVAANVKTATGQ